VEHRLEFVRTVSGVSFYNDSKATNVDATEKALDSFQGGLWVILGGKDKGSDYTVLREQLARKARAVLLVGAVLLRLMERRHPGEYNEPSERAVLLTHIAVFVLVNGILWIQDILAGGGLDYAYWVTIPWGLGLMAHATAYLVSIRHTGQSGTPHPAT